MSDQLDVAFVHKTDQDLTLSVLGSFQFRAGDTSPALPSGSQRLLALLALRDRSVTRLMIAGTLWPESTEQHASASLRSALTRLRGDARAAVDVADLDLNLAPGVVVDIRESKRFAHRLLEPNAPSLAPEATAAAVASLSADLLPDWYEDWVLIETAEWRQLRLHALEAMADNLVAEGRWTEAIAAAQAAIRGEPLRETSHAALIRVFLAEGNQTEALSQFERYRTLLNTELNLEPTAHISDLVTSLGRRSTDKEKGRVVTDPPTHAPTPGGSRTGSD
ncbi:MAG TPA: bacterial transcriptional activator domain-containing protein [Acidimicrobiia bacterium]